MTGVRRKCRVIEGLAPDRIPYDDLMAAQTPTVLKGVAKNWPLVKAGQSSPQQAMAYLKSFYSGSPVVGYSGPPEIGGRFFYNDEVTGFNFEAERVAFDAFLDRIADRMAEEKPPAYYIGSTDLDIYLPGLRQENDLALNNPMFERCPPLVSLWLGNRTVASAHYDMSNNLACCVAGRRRFSLFPPEQVENLYPGPLEPTPGGQVVTMVDIRNPDLDRFPKYHEAMEAGETADLSPGDVLFFPALWWHQVEGLDDFNAMINYWWNVTPDYLDTPQNTLLHAMLSLRDRPQAEKRAWKALFDYYIFGDPECPRKHLPEAAQGNLAPMDENKARRLRAMLLNRLNR